jgi:hypothetical protein
MVQEVNPLVPHKVPLNVNYGAKAMAPALQTPKANRSERTASSSCPVLPILRQHKCRRGTEGMNSIATTAVLVFRHLAMGMQVRDREF